MNKQEKTSAVMNAVFTKSFLKYLSADWASSLRHCSIWYVGAHEKIAKAWAEEGSDSHYASLFTRRQRRILDENIANNDILNDLVEHFVLWKVSDDKLRKMYAEDHLQDDVLLLHGPLMLSTIKEINDYIKNVRSDYYHKLSKEAAEELRKRLKDALKKINKQAA